MNPALLLPLALLLLLVDLPLFVLIGALALALFYASSGELAALQTVIIEINRLTSMPILVALPLFTLAGNLLSRTKAPQRLTALVEALSDDLRGGMAIAALSACIVLTALTGASGVTIVALGGVLYPILRRKGYPEPFALGLITTGGSLGLLFPPSLPVILYGVVAQVDIAAAYRAALLPGLILVAALSAYAIARPLQGRRVAAAGGLAKALREGIWDWPILPIVLVGVFGGLVTIAEVAAVVAGYVLVVACLVKREVHPIKELPGIMVESAMLSGAIIVILGFSLALTAYLVEAQVPDRLLERLTALTDSRWVFLAGLNLLLLLAGCLMDIFSAIVVLVPLIAPLAVHYGVDPLHLCVIFLLNLEIGYSTPPIGMNLFIASLQFDRPISRLYRASLPFLLIMLLVLTAVTYLPALSLWLPR